MLVIRLSVQVRLLILLGSRWKFTAPTTVLWCLMNYRLLLVLTWIALLERMICIFFRVG